MAVIYADMLEYNEIVIKNVFCHGKNIYAKKSPQHQYHF